MTAALTIRPVEADDFEVWKSLWTSYLEFYESTVEDEVYVTSFERLVSDDPHHYAGLLAVLDGEAVGLAHYLLHADMWSIAPVCYLQDLYVNKQARGSGVGRALIEAVCTNAQTRGAPNVYWHTQSFNATARQLYDKIAELTPFVQYSRPASAGKS